MGKVKQASIKKTAILLYNTFGDKASDFETNKDLWNQFVTDAEKLFEV